ncbi:alpha/beta-hydrolase [Dacryopinax primogenitus]|uniref:Dipeptidyl-peptidase V n=1 Tax=Dacryopinax primogenitus (strain DJM 731) TaxID=1858805 RepID=M5GFG6_DACPD|nr:alpha/beta-hydrolase [Dacryopinax primogenitus]EJU04123.1 alpha/beta-hydrolase [Dacryopinax primogenitus]
MDLNGSENFQLWRYWEDNFLDGKLEKIETEIDNAPGRGRVEWLTNDEFKNHYPLVSGNGTGSVLAFSSTRANGKDNKVYTIDLSVEGWNPTLVSMSRWIVDLKNPNNEPHEQLLPGIDNNAGFAIRDAQFSQVKGSTEILVALDAYGDFVSVVICNLSSGVIRHITTPNPSLSPIHPIPWDVKLAAVTAHFAVLLANADGWCEIYRYGLLDSKVEKITMEDHETDMVGPVRPVLQGQEDNRVVIEHNSSHVAFSISLLDLSQPGQLKLEPILACQSASPGFRTQDPILIRFESFDGLSIPALVYYPANMPPTGKMPAVIWIHGGLAMQIRPGFRRPVLYLLDQTNGFTINELGCALIMPKVRGRAGYGRSYVKLDDVYKREDSVKDLGSLLEYISTSMPKIDATRIALNGASYGGFMVLAGLVNYSHLLRCGVVQSGIGNWVTFLETTHPS